MIASIETNGLRFDMFTGEERFLAPNAVLVSGRQDAFLIDCGFVQSDVEKLLAHVPAFASTCAPSSSPPRIPIIAEFNAFAAAFPGATLLARQGVIDGMLEWPAKRLHWQDMFGGMLPAGDIGYPRPLFGKSMYLRIARYSSSTCRSVRRCTPLPSTCRRRARRLRAISSPSLSSLYGGYEQPRVLDRRHQAGHRHRPDRHRLPRPRQNRRSGNLGKRFAGSRIIRMSQNPASTSPPSPRK